MFCKTSGLGLLLALGLGWPSAGTWAYGGAQVALYQDAGSGNGTWAEGVTAIKNMLTNLGYSYEEVNYAVFNNPAYDLSSLYQIIILPGGYAQPYNQWISATGKARIRDFVSKGGGFLGICAGSYFASDRVVWEGQTYDDTPEGYYYNAFSNHHEWFYAYDLDLFSGTASGPLDSIADFSAGRYGMVRLEFNSTSEVLASYKTPPFTENLLYFGGPYFSSAGWWGDTQILATYPNDPNLSGPAAGQAAMIAFEYGSGRVVLSGPHPEIEEDSDRDGVTLTDEATLDDQGSDWDLVAKLLAWLTNPNSVSCPSLYYWDGSEMRRNSYLIPGARLQERTYTDFVPLGRDLRPLPDGGYLVEIRETEQEISYLDHAELWVIDHPPQFPIGDILRIRNTPGDDGHPQRRAWYNQTAGLRQLETLGQVRRLTPGRAHQGDGLSPLAQVAYEDDRLVRLLPGDRLELVFYPGLGPTEPSEPDWERDFLLVSRGYYDPLDAASLDGTSLLRLMAP